MRVACIKRIHITFHFYLYYRIIIVVFLSPVVGSGCSVLTCNPSEASRPHFVRELPNCHLNLQHSLGWSPNYTLYCRFSTCGTTAKLWHAGEHTLVPSPVCNGQATNASLCRQQTTVPSQFGTSTEHPLSPRRRTVLPAMMSRSYIGVYQKDVDARIIAAEQGSGDTYSGGGGRVLIFFCLG